MSNRDSPPRHKFADAGCQLGDVGTLGTVVTGVTCHVSRVTVWSHPSAQWLPLDKKLDKKVMSWAVIKLSSHPF